MSLPEVLRAAPKPKKEKSPIVMEGLAPIESHRRMGWRDDEPFIAPWNAWHDPDPAVKYVKEPEIPALFEDARLTEYHCKWLVTTGYIGYAVHEAAVRVWQILARAASFPGKHVIRQAMGFIAEEAIEDLLALAHRWFYEDHAMSGSWDRNTCCEIVSCLARVDSPDVARYIAKARADLPKAEEDVADWTLRFPRTAAIGFVPLALGPISDERAGARAGLRHLAIRGHAELVKEIAAAHGAEVARAIGLLLAEDPIAADACKHGKLPPFVDLEALGRPTIDGEPIPIESVALLCGMLKTSAVEPPYAGIAEVKRACDAESLDAFAWSLARAWLDAKASPAHVWALHALGHFGRDATELGKLVTGWQKKKKELPRARLALEVFAMMGTPSALFQLSAVSETAKDPVLHARARELLGIARVRHGLTRGELEDRAFPREAEKKERSQIEKIAAKRLERAMVQGRTWTIDALRRDWIEHPILGPLARGVVWHADRPFRIAEDGTFADVEDRTIAVADRVGIVHPMRLHDIEKWIDIFASYDVIQPFAQLARPVRTFDPKMLEKLTGTVVPHRKVMSLVDRGWEPARATYRHQKVYRLVKRVAKGTIELQFTHGQFRGDSNLWRVLHDDLDAIEASELVLDIEWLQGA